MAESIGCLKALEMAEAYGVSRIILELDSSILKAALATNDLLYHAPCGMLVDDIHGLLYDRFVSPVFSLVFRSVNASARVCLVNN